MPNNTRWYKQYRLNWIAESLHIFGFIMREHLERKFGISTPQASIDFRDFMKTSPGSMVYDVSTKLYRSTEDHFNPKKENK